MKGMESSYGVMVNYLYRLDRASCLHELNLCWHLRPALPKNDGSNYK